MWHRFNVLRLEQALRTVSPDDDIAMAYWDETSDETLKFGIPEILTKATVMIDNKEVPNPLRSYTYQQEIVPGANADDMYSKKKGTTTIRYPFSGIQTPPEAASIAAKHNEEMKKRFPTDEKVVEELNRNVLEWLHGGEPSNDQPSRVNSLYNAYARSLNTKSFNVFSNTPSAKKIPQDMSLESPHSHMHLAIGGFTMKGGFHSGRVEGANGDMGENETVCVYTCNNNCTTS